MRIKAGVCLAGLVLAVSGAGMASEISDKMQKLADRLTASYMEKRPKDSGVPLAVMDFQCDERLAKQGVGRGVSELLSTHFVGKPVFRVVERSEVDRVFKEQALQRTGALDVDTAVELGKVVGAKVLCLGSVDKVGGHYQVTSRLVDAQSAEILASSYQELPVDAFESEAKQYLVLVPETQALGFYLLVQYGKGSFTGIAVNHSDSNGTISYDTTYRLKSTEAESSGMGGGVRYFPVSSVMLDLAFLPQAFRTGGKGEVVINSRNPAAGSVESLAEDRIRGLVGMALILKGYYVHNFSTRWRGFAGAGVDLHILEFEQAAGANGSGLVKLNFPPAPGLMYELGAKDLPGHKYLVTRPLVSLGMEWRPQPRIGLAVIGDIFAVRNKVNLYAETTKASGATVEYKYGEVLFPLFEAKTTLSFYF